ncbi:MAG: PKD domain-containing protein [Propionibacteriaceae bacterium]|nr:PKD domain-containing protein [Propionibacteriaceae bacterium]
MRFGKAIWAGAALLGLLVGGLGAADAQAASKVKVLKVGQTVKIDVNGGAKERLQVVAYTDAEYGVGGIQLKINGKAVLSEVNLPSDWVYAVVDFNTSDKYKELLACQYPSDVSNIRCQVYRWTSGKLKEAAYKYEVPYSYGAQNPGHVVVGWKLSSLKPTGKGTFTGTWGDGSGQTHTIKLKLNSKFQVVAVAEKKVTAKSLTVMWKAPGYQDSYGKLATTNADGETVTPYASWPCAGDWGISTVTFKALPGSWKPSGVKYSYQWYFEGKKIAGATSATYKDTRPGAYSVKVTGKKKGYQSASKSFDFEIPESAGACM